MKKLISCILIFALLCSLSVSAFAELSTGQNAGAQLKLIANSFGMLCQPDGKDPWEEALTEAAWNDYFDMLWDVQDYGYGDWNDYGATLCPNCYSEVPSGVAVCPYCGSYVW